MRQVILRSGTRSAKTASGVPRSLPPLFQPILTTATCLCTVTPFGRHFALMEASDLLLIDHEGKIVDGGKEGRRFYNTLVTACSALMFNLCSS